MKEMIPQTKTWRKQRGEMGEEGGKKRKRVENKEKKKKAKVWVILNNRKPWLPRSQQSLIKICNRDVKCRKWNFSQT